MSDEQQTQALALSQPKQLAVVETASSAMAQQAAAIVQARYIMAERHPRDLDVVREKLRKECTRPSFAEVARYNKPVGKKGITGPSIRFAEAALRCMTNIVVETITIYDDETKRIVQVSVTDLEANVPYSQSVTVEKTVERSSAKPGDVVVRQRLNSYNKPVYVLQATDDDILNKQNALISKAIRTLGLRLVPGDIIDECMDLVLETQKKKDAEDPDTAKRKLFDAFGSQGVSAAQIKEWLGHAGNNLTPKEMADLRGLYAALRDGETTWREVMEARGGSADDKPPADDPERELRATADILLSEHEPQYNKAQRMAVIGNFKGRMQELIDKYTKKSSTQSGNGGVSKPEVQSSPSATSVRETEKAVASGDAPNSHGVTITDNDLEGIGDQQEVKKGSTVESKRTQNATRKPSSGSFGF
jgi:hypothetical protein